MAKITAFGTYVPEKILDNKYFEEIVDTNDEWIVSRTGIHTRHVAAKNEFTSNLAIKAVKNLQERSGKSIEDEPHSGEEFGYVLDGTVTLRVGKKRYICNKGDSFYYIANKYHYLENTSNTLARVLWVSTPPMF